MAPKSSAKGLKLVSQPPQSTGSALRTISLVLLPLLSIAGVYTTLVLARGNGTLDIIRNVVEKNSPLPGTRDPLVRSYTGLEGLDTHLAVLVTFFAPVVDKSHSGLTLSGGFGLGQFGAAWTLLTLESFRAGNKSRIVSYLVIFGLILQNITFAATIPIYLFIHLLTSPVASLFPGKHASSVLLVSSADLEILPFSMILGYIVPSVLMALPAPSIVSPTLHQQFIALWQPFPLWTAIIQFSAKIIYPVFAKSNNQADSLGKSYLSAAKYTYGFVLVFCIITHLPVLAITALPPSTFENSAAELIRLSQSDLYGVYVPHLPVLGLKFSSLAEGVQNFLVWDLYVGLTAVLLWTTLMYRNATVATANWLSWPKLVFKIIAWSLVSGPMGAAAILLWERDAIVSQKVKHSI